MPTDFFGSDYGKELLGTAKRRIQDGPTPKGEKEARLLQALHIISTNGTQFDKAAAVNIGLIGSSISGYVDRLAEPSKYAESLDGLYALLFRVVQEFELSLAGDKEPTFELGAFLNYPRQHSELFNSAAQDQLRWAEQSMPIAIMKRLLGSEILMNVRNIAEYSKTINDRFQGWESALNSREQRVTGLSDSLKQYETAFNFVGLYQGFDELSKAKRIELWVLRFIVLLMGLAVLAPLTAELWIVYQKVDQIEQYRWALAASVIPVVSLTVLLAYYFRLAVRSADAAKSQLLQIELRKTLCRFIQSYADSSKDLREKGAPAMDKFENVVFSSIVSSEDKMPTTFDGVDQLAKLVKALKAA